MFRRVIFGGLILALALGGPMVFFSAPDYWKAVCREWVPAMDQPAEGSAGDVPAAISSEPTLEGPPVRSLAEVFRFDVSTGWVMQRWPRVSTGLAQLQLQGYRVPLVTGTAKTDLAGALTYYFNPKQQVQRITFHGTTGDATRLIELLTTRYRFARRLTNDPGIFVYEAVSPGSQPAGVLRVQAAQVVKASEPRHRFQVELFIERPS